MQRYPHLMLQKRVWSVRMVVPPDVRGLLGKTIIKVTTKETDIHRAATIAAPIIAGIKQAITIAREKRKPPVEVRAEQLATRFREKFGNDAERFLLTNALRFALEETGQSIPLYKRIHVQPNGALIPQDSPAAQTIRLIKGTPFKTHVDAWAKQVAINPKTRDEYLSAINDFAKLVSEPLETLKGAHVQVWVDAVIGAGDDEGLDAQTVHKRLSGLRNYWHYMTKRGFVDEERKPFHRRDVKNPASHRKVAMQRLPPERRGAAVAGCGSLWQRCPCR